MPFSDDSTAPSAAQAGSLYTLAEFINTLSEDGIQSKETSITDLNRSNYGDQRASGPDRVEGLEITRRSCVF